MADLSELLGDVYGELTPAGPDDAPAAHEPTAEARRPATPEWASDEKLDEAFDSWTPGPPPDAPQAERDVLAPPPPPAPAPLDDDLAAALSAALAETPAPATASTPTRRSRTSTEGWAAKPLPFAGDPGMLTLPEPVVEPAEVAAGDEPDGAGEPERPAAAATEATVTEAAVVEAMAPVPVPSRRWERSDDDILPRAARPVRGGRFRLR